MPKAELTQARLRELLDYDPLTGVFVHKTTRGRLCKAGQVAGYLHQWGYIHINISGKIYKAHRLAWLYVHGSFPPNHIDHINGNRSDNRLVNLRPATKSENGCNRGAAADNTSGWCGVSFDKSRGKYIAQISVEKIYRHLGRYDSPEIAAAVYNHVVVQVHGEFAKPDLPDWLIADSSTIKAIGGNMRQIAKCLAVVAIHNAQLETQTTKENP